MNAPARTDTRRRCASARPIARSPISRRTCGPSSPSIAGLAARGFSTPKILAEDLDTGVLLLEDLGTAGVVDAGGPIAERYGVAIDVLAALHAMPLPDGLPVAAGHRP